MGKIIQFPLARIPQRRSSRAAVFTAFGEMESLERAQLKLFAACAACAVLLTAAFQLAAG